MQITGLQYLGNEYFVERISRAAGVRKKWEDDWDKEGGTRKEGIRIREQ